MSLRLLAATFAVLFGAQQIECATAGEPLPFGRGSWQELRQAHAARPTVVHFWALTCGPCLVELPLWGALVRERPDLSLVLINTDRVSDRPERMIATLDKAGLGAVESWAFADRFAERLRFEVDPQWRGELPRTVLIAGDGAVTAFSGAADPTHSPLARCSGPSLPEITKTHSLARRRRLSQCGGPKGLARQRASPPY